VDCKFCLRIYRVVSGRKQRNREESCYQHPSTADYGAGRKGKTSLSKFEDKTGEDEAVTQKPRKGLSWWWWWWWCWWWCWWWWEIPKFHIVHPSQQGETRSVAPGLTWMWRVAARPVYTLVPLPRAKHSPLLDRLLSYDSKTNQKALSLKRSLCRCPQARSTLVPAARRLSLR